jgi:hypothetical protein
MFKNEENISGDLKIFNFHKKEPKAPPLKK